MKDNFLFSSGFKSNSSKITSARLKNSDGEKIRFQYFNQLMFITAGFLPMPIVMIAFSELKRNTFDFLEFLKFIPSVFLMWGVIFSPLIVLSLLNRFFFGKIVSVLSIDELIFENDTIKLKDITKIVYSPRVSGRTSLKYTYATIFVKSGFKEEYSVKITHFPLYGLRKIKKYNSEIEIVLDKRGLFTILFFALVPTIFTVILSLFI